MASAGLHDAPAVDGDQQLLAQRRSFGRRQAGGRDGRPDDLAGRLLADLGGDRRRDRDHPLLGDVRADRGRLGPDADGWNRRDIDGIGAFLEAKGFGSLGELPRYLPRD